MADNKEVKSRRDKHLERLRTRYPERSFEDEEEIFGTISDDYDQYEQELGDYRDREKTLSDMFAADPRSAQFLTDMHKGQSPWASYIRLFGPELKDTLEDPSTIEQIKQAETDYVARVAESKKLEEAYSANIEETKRTLEKFQTERGMSDSQIDEVFAVLLGIVRDGVMGKFLPETLEMICKAVNYDADVRNASEEGEIAGRNARISEQLRTSQKGDGTAPLSGKNNTPAPKQARSKSIFDLANEAM